MKATKLKPGDEVVGWAILPNEVVLCLLKNKKHSIGDHFVDQEDILRYNRLRSEGDFIWLGKKVFESGLIEGLIEGMYYEEDL